MTKDNFIDEAKEEIGQLMESYWSKIESAYLHNPDELSIGFTIKIAPGKTDFETLMETSMSFVAERCKDKTKGVIDDRQTRIE